MDYAISDLYARTQAWLDNVVAGGWLPPAAYQGLAEGLAHAAQDRPVHSNGQPRPLRVALMGGTGVGKSSLLNRLAGQAIAQVGVERPTSRHVTLYCHQAIALSEHLPEALLQASQVAFHQQETLRQRLWLDMPDMDSIELDNRRLVLDWLPQCDVVLYVVSPDRYRDHSAWQLLQAQGGQHAWLFVMNQWDRGQTEQLDDFKRQLRQAGFDQPLVVSTCCTEALEDEFDLLLQHLQQLADQPLLAALAARQADKQRHDLLVQLQALTQSLPTGTAGDFWLAYTACWQAFENDVRQGLHWGIEHYAQAVADPAAALQKLDLWDAWAQSRWRDTLDSLLLLASDAGIASHALKQRLQHEASDIAKRLDHHTHQQLRIALVQPGCRWQRRLRRGLAIAETVLPLTAMSVVGYQVFSGYYYSSTAQAGYLGVDFAIHSVLLIGLSGLIPYFLHQKTQPSRQSAARKGLEHGLAITLAEQDAALRATLEAQWQQQLVWRQALQQLLTDCQQQPQAMPNDPVLARVLTHG